MAEPTGKEGAKLPLDEDSLLLEDTNPCQKTSSADDPSILVSFMTDMKQSMSRMADSMSAMGDAWKAIAGKGAVPVDPEPSTSSRRPSLAPRTASHGKRRGSVSSEVAVPTKRRKREFSDREEISSSESGRISSVSSGNSSCDDAEQLIKSAQVNKNSADTNKLRPTQTDGSPNRSQILKDMDEGFENKTHGPKVGDVLAHTVNKRWKNRMNIQVLKDTIAKYSVPENCDMMRVPRVNHQVFKNLSKFHKGHDKTVVNIQKSCVAIGSAITMTIDKLVETKDPHVLDTSELIRNLTDSVALLGNVNYELSLRRREDMKPALSSVYRSLCNADHEVTAFLFGDDLQKEMKDVKETSKIGRDIRQSQSGWSKGNNSYHRYDKRTSHNTHGGRRDSYNQDFSRGAGKRPPKKKFKKWGNYKKQSEDD